MPKFRAGQLVICVDPRLKEGLRLEMHEYYKVVECHPSRDLVYIEVPKHPDRMVSYSISRFIPATGKPEEVPK